MPARSAGLPGAVRTMITPSTPSRVATASLAATMPIPGVGTRPFLISSGTTRLTISAGIAKPMPALEPEGEMIAVLTPISRPGRIQQRPARIAGIDRGIGLDHVGDLAAAAGRQPALERADDAAGQRLIEPERIADRKRGLTDLEFGRTAQRHRRRQLTGIPDPQHREVIVGRDADDFGLRHLARGEANRNLAAVLDDVIVGDDMAAVVPDEAGAGGGSRRLRPRPGDWRRRIAPRPAPPTATPARTVRYWRARRRTAARADRRSARRYWSRGCSECWRRSTPPRRRR